MNDIDKRLTQGGRDNFSRFTSALNKIDPVMFGVITGLAFAVAVTGPAVVAEMAHRADIEAMGLKDWYIEHHKGGTLHLMVEAIKGNLQSETLQTMIRTSLFNGVTGVAAGLGLSLAKQFVNMKDEIGRLSQDNERLMRGEQPLRKTEPADTPQRDPNAPRGATRLEPEELAKRQENYLSAQLERGLRALEQSQDSDANRPTQRGPRLG